jgi:hypothetical protein
LSLQDLSAAAAFLDRLRVEPQHLGSLMGVARVALATGRRDAARTVLGQVTRHHAGVLSAWVTLGNMALEDGEAEVARRHYQVALATDSTCVEARQGLARSLAALGEPAAAEPFWASGFVGHAIAPRRFRGACVAAEVLYLAAARGGNVRLWPWLDETHVAVTVIYADYADPLAPLPRHDRVINAIGDADVAHVALANAVVMMESATGRVINHPDRVRRTGRRDLSGLCHGIDGLVAPLIHRMDRTSVLLAEGIDFPVLIRASGFHTGQYFTCVASPAELAPVLATMPGDEFFVIHLLDGRGPDGMVRKYRVMFIDGKIYPWHLAISSDWKVHYFTAAMAEQKSYRAEEQQFLNDMPNVLGRRAMTALGQLCRRLGLDYAGVDFGLAADGSVLAFEANASMTINDPPSGAIWDYRRSAVAVVQAAASRMLCGTGDVQG